MMKWEEDMPINKPKFIFDNRAVSSGYVIAKLANDDSRMYDGDDDPCDYLKEDSSWGYVDDAEIFANETLLAVALENEKRKTVAVFPAPMLIPIFVQTTITTVDNKAFDEHVLQIKRAKAMAKLDAEDLVVLGLMGAAE